MKRSILSNAMIATLLAQSVVMSGMVPLVPVQAETLSASVSALEFEAVNRFGKVGQKIVFHADMPFQYRVDVLNDDQIQLTLQNARLSDALMGGSGLLNIVPGGAVKSAALKPGGAYEQIVLSGPDLGKRDIYIEGAIRAAGQPPQLRLSPVTPGVQQVARRIDIEDTLSTADGEMAIQPPATYDVPQSASQTRQQVAQDLESLEPLRLSAAPAAAAVPTGFLMPAGTSLDDLQKPVDKKAPGKLGYLTKKLVSTVQDHLPDLPQRPAKKEPPAQEAPMTALSMADTQSISRQELQASPAFQALETLPVAQPARAVAKPQPAAAQPDRMRLSSPPGRNDSLGWLKQDEAGASAPRTGGPQIVEIVSARSKRTYNGGESRSRAVFPIDSNYPANLPQTYPVASQFNAPEPALSAAPAQPQLPAWSPPVSDTALAAIPEEAYVKPLPRYQGGSQPITATVSGTGQTVSYQGTVGPQFKQPSVDPDSLEETEPVNNLFYQDSSRDLVERMMAQALTHYRAGDRKAALSRLNEALAMEPKHPKLLAAKGEILIEQQRLDEAETVYEQAASLAPEASLLRYAEVLILNSKQAQARPILEKYVQTLALDKKSPDKGRAHYMLGTLYQQAGEFPFAIAHLREAADLNPASADIQYNLGLAYELQGKLTLAQGHYQKAVELNPEAEDAQSALRRVKI